MAQGVKIFDVKFHLWYFGDSCCDSSAISCPFRESKVMWAKRPVVSPKCVLFCEKSCDRSNDMQAWARAQNDITMTAIRGMVRP